MLLPIVIKLTVTDKSIRLIVIMLSVVMLNVILLNVVFSYCFADCHCAVRVLRIINVVAGATMFSMTTFSITTISITTISIMTISIMIISKAIRQFDIQQNITQHSDTL
jgi:hypothetical protein